MGGFKYTHGGGVLTEEQRQFYEENGYIVIKNNVSHALLDELRQRFIDICDGRVGPKSLNIMKESSLKHKDFKGEHLINKLQDLFSDEILSKYCKNRAILDVVESIVGPNISCVNSMVLNKPPYSDPDTSCHPLHQDLHYFPFRPAERVVASWTAMERADENNGCLYIVPGTHKSQLYEHDYPEGNGLRNELYHGIPGLDHLPKLHLTMEKGDSVFFHPVLLHGSGPNKTEGFRKAASCHFADSNCYFIDVKGTSQEKISLELEVYSAKKGTPLRYDDFWKAKSRLVRGVPGNFQKLSTRNVMNIF